MRGRVLVLALATSACSLYFGDSPADRSGDDDDGDDQDEVETYACTDVTPLPAFDVYLKASNIGAEDAFGSRVAISADGSTIAIAAIHEASAALGVNGQQDDDSATDAGAVYVFARYGATWSQQAYLKPGFRSSGNFGMGLSISADGSTIVVGQPWAPTSGVAYVFARTGTTWRQEQMLTASVPHDADFFGFAVAISGDASTIAIGAYDENSIGQPGHDQTFAGAVHMFAKGATGWTETANFAASTTVANDYFGHDLALSHSGATLVVGAPGVSQWTGAAYVFARHGTRWVERAQLTAANADILDDFGMSVAISGDGSTIAIGAPMEDGEANSVPESGAVYLFTRDEGHWSQSAYLKASNAGGGDGPPLGSGSGPGGSDPGDELGGNVALSGCGSRLVVGAAFEDSAATGIDGESSDNSAPTAGAAYVFARANGSWSQRAYVKASNTDAGDEFGSDVAISDGGAIVVGAPSEQSSTMGNAQDDGYTRAGAAYTRTGP